jgi:hypothetical protein
MQTSPIRPTCGGSRDLLEHVSVGVCVCGVCFTQLQLHFYISEVINIILESRYSKGFATSNDVNLNADLGVFGKGCTICIAVQMYFFFSVFY